ncbi:hypothetical protein I553_8468 [Mycobacterium xenopi 4042]|uniref:Uncharacterized protein n=1 Tax=Mycobacterium xenopi 4042 TaxID=1299334 RepID=X8CMF0_MYCXE|nr:hypothetical protein I553_8468 [Mycobacterium xenopi 4042]
MNVTLAPGPPADCRRGIFDGNAQSFCAAEGYGLYFGYR